MAKVVVYTCDQCGVNTGVARYTITTTTPAGSRTASVDLCKRHSEPLDAALSVAPPPKASANRQVMTIDAINALRRARD